MAILPWRFQCDMTFPQDMLEPHVSETDPEVTVFVGSTYTNDITQKTELHRSADNPMKVKLSALPAFLQASADGIAREKLPTPTSEDDTVAKAEPEVEQPKAKGKR